MAFQLAFDILSIFCAFLTAYKTAASKETYLQSLNTDKKPSIDDQFEAIVVDFLNNGGLQYTGGYVGGEAKAKKTIKLLLKVVKFVYVCHATN